MINLALRVLVALSALLITCNAAAINGTRPFYSIAHRCLTKGDIDAAIDDGADAIETDMAAWKKWYADHDVDGSSEGDTAETLFKHIAKVGKGKISFVWLDMKNPDWCGKDAEFQECTIKYLQDLVHDHLTKNDIRVMYEFYDFGSGHKDEVPYKHETTLAKSPAFKHVRENLNPKEAISITAKFDTAQKDWKEKYQKIPLKQRLYDVGATNMHKDNEELLNEHMPYLKDAVKQQGKLFNKVFTFTANEDDEKQTKKVMDAGVDGLIYGNLFHNYGDKDYRKDVKKARKFISDYIKDPKKKANVRAPKKGENPW